MEGISTCGDGSNVVSMSKGSTVQPSDTWTTERRSNSFRRGSIINRNSVGERTEPCRTPRSKVIELESFLFTCILHLGLVYQEFSSLQALPLIPQSNARLSNSGYWTVSKAFWMSKKQI